MNDFFINRRSVRNYSKRDVDDKMLREMLREAAQAPTTGNMQLYSVIVTRSDEGKAALAPAHFGQPAVTGAAVVLTFCADFNRFVKWCEASDAKPGYDNFEMFMCAVLDTAIVAQQFVTIAEMRGLGTCYMGTTTYNAPQIGAALQLPKLVVPVVTVTVGWPEGETEVSDRLPLDSFVSKRNMSSALPERSVLSLPKKKSATAISPVRTERKRSLRSTPTSATHAPTPSISRVSIAIISNCRIPFPRLTV